MGGLGACAAPRAAHPVLLHGRRLPGRLRDVRVAQPDPRAVRRARGEIPARAGHIIRLVNHLDGARWTTSEALWKLDTGRPAAASVHMAKAVASEAYLEACNA